ncbi:MAG: AAA family ATPase [Anaerolineae bacterium]
MNRQHEPGINITIPNYQLLRVLGEGRNAIVYQAYRQQDPQRQPLTLKVFKDRYPSPGQQARFRHELRILQRLNSPYLVRAIDLEEQAGIFILVSQYNANLQSLRDWLDQNPFSVDSFLKIAIQIVRALEDIHRQGVLHGDLKPSNILVNQTADIVKITDFGMSRIFEQHLSYHPETQGGSLPYISPEQTGRTNKPIDYRSDYYSLGITLFQLATGQLPFEAKDHLSLIHAHLALEAPPATMLNPALPQPLSQIIFQLMAKNPEDRYQDAAAIRFDLERCQNDWLTSGAIASFPLRTADQYLRFEVSPKLYGREFELRRLNELLQQIGQGPTSLTLVAGSAGIGKSSLIQALQPAIVAIRGMFVANKYDQYQRNIPYSALVRSLQTLLLRLLREPVETLQTWRINLAQAVGINSRVISEVIPELELLLGPQPAIPTLPPEQAQTRFITTFSQFLRACSTAEQPLVLFLDDLQWADDSSLDFLQALLADSQPAHILIIGAYRDTEVNQEHRLQRLITQLAKSGRPPYQIILTPLDLSATKELLTDTLYDSPPQSPLVVTDNTPLETLTQLLYHKSGGNPFFLTTLLHNLYDDGLLTPVPLGNAWESKPTAGLRWQWDLTAIQQARLSDNIIDLLLYKLERLPDTSLQLLKQAACLGNSFTLTTLALVSQFDFETLYAQLEPALQADLMREQAETISFVHDRVQEAVYHQLTEAERQQQHWHIGQTLLAHYSPQTLDEQLFAVVNQLNQGRQLAQDETARAQLARLNFQAGLKARQSIAFEASLNYFQINADLLPPNSWQTSYTQTYEIWYELLIANILLYQYNASLSVAEVMLAHAQTDFDKARCYRRLVSLYAWHSHFNQAVEVGNQALALFNQALPTEPQAVRQALGSEFKHLAVHLTNTEAILNLPEMTDPLALIQLELRYELTPPLYRTSAELLVLNNLQMIRLALAYGSHPSLSIAFVGSAVAMIVQGQLKQAVLFNSIASALYERYPTAFETAQNIVAAAWSSPVVFPNLETIRRQNRRGQTLCINVSNIYYWAASLVNQTLTELVDGQNLTNTFAEAEKIRGTFFQQYRVDRYRQLGVAIIESYLKPMLGLERMDLSALEQELINAQFAHCVFHLRILAGMLNYIFGEYAVALDFLTRTQEFAASQPTGLINPLWHIYHALTLLALAQENSSTENVTQAEELLAKVEPLTTVSSTFTPYIALVQAELAYTRWEPTWHSTFFAAIDQATKAEYILLQALLHERLARHMLAAGYRSSRGHIEEAVYLYQQCGAVAKVQQLRYMYTFYLRPTPGREPSSDSSDSSPNDSSQTLPALHRDLDTYAILQASQAISSEIELERVVSVIMQTLGQVSGAESAYLIMEQDGQREIRARYQARTGQTLTGLNEGIRARGSDLVSDEVVRYVHRTRQTLLLDDAFHSGEFTTDPYIQRHRVRSVLCQPIQEQNRLIGSIYLENRLSSYAFTPERAEVVRLLASQAAISLTNAEAILARTEQERTQHELDIAREVQLNFLPRHAPASPYFELAHTSQPARQVSGDLYGYFQRPGGGLATAIGDVTGKGIPAALLMSAAIIALAGAIEADLPPGPTLTRTDHVLQPFVAPRQNVGICLAYLDQGQMQVANAGAISPIIRTQAGTSMLIEAGGLPLGIDLARNLVYKNLTVPLVPGDFIILTTDGLVEAMEGSYELYGFERLEAAIAAGPTDSAQAMLDHLLADLRQFIGRAELQDDLTLVVIKVTA